MKRTPYIDEIPDRYGNGDEARYLVYQWSREFNRMVCTHQFQGEDGKREAELTIKQRKRQ